MLSVDVCFKDDATVDQLVDVIEGNRVPIPDLSFYESHNRGKVSMFLIISAIAEKNKLNRNLQREIGRKRGAADQISVTRHRDRAQGILRRNRQCAPLLSFPRFLNPLRQFLVVYLRAPPSIAWPLPEQLPPLQATPQFV